MQTSLTHSLLRSAALVALLAAPLAAQERNLFTWGGRVDDDVRVQVRAADIRTQLVSGNAARAGYVTHVSPLPHRDGTIRVEQLRGRGTITVVQQPSAANNYTAIIDIKDADSGPDMYRFAAYFTPTQSVGGDVGTGAMPSSGDVILHWSGNVDRDVLISLRGHRIRTQALSGLAAKGVAATVWTGGLPLVDHQVSLQQREGRGTITITEQPTEANNYRMAVRVRDGRPGFGYYDFDIVW